MATVAQLETRARILVDQDDANFPTSLQYMELLSNAAALCWGKLIAAGWEPGRTVATLSATGSTSYLISQTAEMVLDVFYVQGTTRTRLVRLRPEQMATMLGQTGTGTHYELYWDQTTGLRIKLHPTPATGTYEVHYVPQFTRFTDPTTDTWFGPARSDDFIATYAALQAANKEGDVHEMLVGMLKEIEEDMVRRLSWVDARNPGTVRDVHGEDAFYEMYPFDKPLYRPGGF